MELQFQKNTYDCLHRAAWEIKNEEQTKELKLPDAMPDVGRVLGAWGQVVVRGKEWRGNGMSISGGVMTWVLYAPEDGTEPRSVEEWIPFQIRWDFPEMERDGAIVTHCLLQGVDARAVSARKLMARVVVSAAGEALAPIRAELFTPNEVPDDVCLLKKSYPVCLPREAGEKTFQLDEELQLPSACENAQRLLYYTLQPELVDKKVMADKVVFRGAALLHGLCRCADGKISTFDFEIPFSQYADLEREYDPHANACIIPVVTNLELELQDTGKLLLKAGMVGQYVIYDRPILEIVEDAYSPNRSVTLQTQQLELPMVLEQRQETVQAAQIADAEATQILDVVFNVEDPLQHRREDQIQMELPGSFQILYYGPEGNLQSQNARWQDQRELQADPETSILMTGQPSGRPQASLDGTTIHIRADMLVDMMSVTQSGLSMVTALEVGEKEVPDPGRPSLILRSVGTESLWNVAKSCGSTVDAIRQANGLEDEPENGRILLIPVS